VLNFSANENTKNNFITSSPPGALQPGELGHAQPRGPPGANVIKLFTVVIYGFSYQAGVFV
jgi:hypothetical protein